MPSYPVMAQVDLHLAKWIVRKHKRGSLVRAFEWLQRIRHDCPTLFAHWGLAYGSTTRAVSRTAPWEVASPDTSINIHQCYFVYFIYLIIVIIFI